jgi:hypothetical protein
MSASHWIRRIHRWVSVAFTLAFMTNIVALSLGQGQPPAWITYSPLPPLLLLLLTGLYLYALPYLIRRPSEGQQGNGT